MQLKPLPGVLKKMWITCGQLFSFGHRLMRFLPGGFKEKEKFYICGEEWTGGRVIPVLFYDIFFSSHL